MLFLIRVARLMMEGFILVPGFRVSPCSREKRLRHGSRGTSQHHGYQEGEKGGWNPKQVDI